MRRFTALLVAMLVAAATASAEPTAEQIGQMRVYLSPDEALERA